MNMLMVIFVILRLKHLINYNLYHTDHPIMINKIFLFFTNNTTIYKDK